MKHSKTASQKSITKLASISYFFVLCILRVMIWYVQRTKFLRYLCVNLLVNYEFTLSDIQLTLFAFDRTDPVDFCKTVLTLARVFTYIFFTKNRKLSSNLISICWFTGYFK